INPATTEEYAPVCGIEAHTHTDECWDTVKTPICEWEEAEAHVHGDACYEIVKTCVCGMEEDEEHTHTDECFVEDRVLTCTLPEGIVHEHTEDCIVWEDELVCGMEDDPEHEHSESCYEKRPVFVCGQQEEGVGHVHNEFCFLEERCLICGKEEHEHTDPCYPKLTGNPHADVEIDLDWESTFCNVELTGNWAEDLVAIAASQIGYAESEENFVTDEYNVRHGYTRYGDWYGNRYAGWNAIYVMFCLHYADVWGIPTDSVPANWMNSARAQGFWTEADGEPIRGDLVFFDDDADGFADRIAIVTDVTDDEIVTIIGGTQVEVHEETFSRTFPNIAGYLALPENPNPPVADAELVTLKAAPAASLPVNPDGDIVLTTTAEDGRTITLRAAAESLPYPAEELSLAALPLTAEDCAAEMDIIEEELTADGRKVTEAQFYDITVWRDEPVRIDVPAETPAEATAEAPASEPVFEIRRTAVVPEGPYEVTVDGFEADNEMRVWHGTADGMTILDPVKTGGSVTVMADDLN
ncbi:MAG: hypothetical protein II715_01245, partial [Clostridia bacterium]|nr:hypothetical protein [Clostridia bacterium]